MSTQISEVLSKYALGPLDQDPARLEATTGLATKMHALFVGRSDVHAEQKQAKSGKRKLYFPVCANKFSDGCLIGKESHPCDECEAQRLVPLSVDVLKTHVLGTRVVGMYLIENGRVRVAAVDFDDHSEGGISSAIDPSETPLIRGARLVDAARSLGLRMFLERSGGGHGTHAWLFFRDWIASNHARKLMEILLRKARIPLNVEIFPRQRDPRKFGNLIALPYQGGVANWNEGRSAFIDPDTSVVLDPLAVMEDIEESLVTEIEVMRLRKEHGKAEEEELEAAAHDGRGAEASPPEAFVENPIEAVFTSCEAMRALRDATQPLGNHTLSHRQRVALASVLRLIPGGTEELHRIFALHCADYHAGETDHHIGSLTCPPMVCGTFQNDGFCHDTCSAIRERGSKSPAAFAYKKEATPFGVETGKVEIKITTDQRSIYDAAVEALRSHRDVFQRGGLIVSVVSGSPARVIKNIKYAPDQPRVSLMPKPWIELRLTEVAQFLTFKHGSWSAAPPPDTLINQLYNPLILPDIRVLVSVTESPQQRPDGTLCLTPGYDAITGWFYRPLDTIPRPPEQPTQQDAKLAANKLFDVVRDFPFADEASRSTWLALVLTCFARTLIDDALPLFVIDANVRGAGKSLLAQVTSLIATGRTAATVCWSGEETESKKLLTTLFVSGSPFILFDNVTRRLGGAALNTALTSTVWMDRILGETRDTGNIPLRSVMVATSNNATFGADTIRRTVRIRLHSMHEHPEDRTDVSEAELRRSVSARRPGLVAAALTILRAFYEVPVAERPRVPPMGDYIGWKYIRSLCVWLGLPDPLKSQKTLGDEADEESHEHVSLMHAMRRANPDNEWLPTLTYLDRAAVTPGPLSHPHAIDASDLRAVLLEYHSTPRSELPSAVVLGQRLAHFCDRIADGMVIRRTKDESKKSLWRIESVFQDTEEGEA